MSIQFGRLYSPDERDQQHLIAPRTSSRSFRYWFTGGWWGNQKSTPRCVAFAWLHWLEDGPITHGLVPPPMIEPKALYDEAQRLDEWPGEDYDGTSVRGAAKALKRRGLISEYQWAFNLDTAIVTLLEDGPLVFGTEWLAGMMTPNREGIVTATGDVLGGHAFKVDGISLVKGLARIKNSWGREWGKRGFAWISLEDLAELLRRDGECCLAVETEDA